MKPSLKHKLIRYAHDTDDVLKAYEPLAVRIFLVVTALFALIRAAAH